MVRRTRNTPPEGEPSTPPEKAAPGAGFPMTDPAHAGPDDDFDQVEEAAPVTPSPHLLRAAHQRFAQEYTVDLNATRAYMRVYADATVETAGAQGHELLKRPEIRREVQRILDERAMVTGITADRALLRIWETATADPRELVEVRVGACRHCWGLYHQYQYTDTEFEAAQREHLANEKATAKAEKRQFDPNEHPCPERGGTGYTPNRPPNAECPECWGDGEPRAIIKDQASLSPAARAIFGGVKYDKTGNLTVIVRDQMPALRMAAEHLGLLSDKLPGPTVDDPLTALLKAIRGEHGAGSALPVVHDDPERRAAVQDVVARAVTPAKKKDAAPVVRKSWKPIRD